MWLKLEDELFLNARERYEYINSDNITRIRITRKRIKIWVVGSIYSYIFVGNTKCNRDELRKIDHDIDY